MKTLWRYFALLSTTSDTAFSSKASILVSNVWNSGSTSSSGLRLAVVNSPAATRLTSDDSPGGGAYVGYALFMNMATTLGSSSAFQLMARNAPATSSAFLSSSGSWNTLTNGAGKNVTGYADGVTYTLVMTFTRNAANGLDITATMTGGSLNNTGQITVTHTDAAPNSFTFDTFGVRPSKASDSATDFDTTLFEAEFIPGNSAPSVSIAPQDADVLVGQDTTFNVVASGTPPLHYQWYFNTNAPIADATNSTLTLQNIQAANAGAYSVTITNIAGAVNSTNAEINVTSTTAGQPQLSNLVLTNGVFTLSVKGGRGPDYIVQVSTNLVDWSSLFTNHAPALPFVWSDTKAGNFTRRFYRIQNTP